MQTLTLTLTLTLTHWAVKDRSKNKLDGVTENLVWYPRIDGTNTPRLFTTKKAAKEFIEQYYGYIRDRPDLRAEPHGWRMPVPVKVSITIKEIE